MPTSELRAIERDAEPNFIGIYSLSPLSQQRSRYPMSRNLVGEWRCATKICQDNVTWCTRRTSQRIILGYIFRKIGLYEWVGHSESIIWRYLVKLKPDAHLPSTAPYAGYFPPVSCDGVLLQSSSSPIKKASLHLHPTVRAPSPPSP